MQEEYLLPLPVVEGEVNIDDLVLDRPGRIIRMRHADSLRYIPPAEDWYEHVAGMISDGA